MFAGSGQSSRRRALRRCQTATATRGDDAQFARDAYASADEVL
jgi:hypothetical protein